MTVGMQFLSAVIRENDRRALQEIATEWLNEDERDAYDIIKNHLRTYAELPSAAVLRQSRIVLPAAQDAVAYYMAELPRRAIHARFRERHPEFVRLMERRDVTQARVWLKDLLDFANLTGNHNEVQTLRDKLPAIAERARTLSNTAGLLGVTTGIPVLDYMTGGGTPADVIAILGRPGIGKSYQIFHMANAANAAGKRILLVSMELSVDQCAERIAGMNTGVMPQDLRRGYVSSHIRQDFFGTLAGIGNRPPFHFLAGNFKKNVDDVDVLIQELDPEAVYIDAAYLLSPARNRKRAGRREYIADTVEEIKGVAVARNKPVFLTMQLARSAGPGKGGAKEKELDVSHAGETDVVGQIVSVAIGVRAGLGIKAKRERRNDVMKNREGDDFAYNTHFQFSPMLFSQVPGSERSRDGKLLVIRDLANNDDGPPDDVDDETEAQPENDATGDNGETYEY